MDGLVQDIGKRAGVLRGNDQFRQIRPARWLAWLAGWQPARNRFNLRPPNGVKGSQGCQQEASISQSPI